MLGSLLQVNQQLTPITYWQDWLTNTLRASPRDHKLRKQSFPAEDGTDYCRVMALTRAMQMPATGPWDLNNSHALERRVSL